MQTVSAHPRRAKLETCGSGCCLGRVWGAVQFALLCACGFHGRSLKPIRGDTGCVRYATGSSGIGVILGVCVAAVAAVLEDLLLLPPSLSMGGGDGQERHVRLLVNRRRLQRHACAASRVADNRLIGPIAVLFCGHGCSPRVAQGGVWLLAPVRRLPAACDTPSFACSGADGCGLRSLGDMRGCERAWWELAYASDGQSCRRSGYACAYWRCSS